MHIFFMTLGIVSCDSKKISENWVAKLSPIHEKNLTEVFKGIDKKLLVTNIKSKNNVMSFILLSNTANKIASFFYYTKNIDIRTKFVNNLHGIITLGLVYALYENYNTYKTNLNGREALPPDSFDCFMTAVGTVIGITQAQSIWQSIVAGATVQSVVDALILIAKRVAAVVTVSIMIYEAGQCLHWWST